MQGSAAMTAAAGAQAPDFLANCGEFALAFARAAPQERSFLSARYAAGELGAWVQETRERLIDLLHYAPERCALMPEVVAREECEGYTRESVLISTAPWSRVPCEVLIPKRPRGGEWPAPAVVALHCHGGLFRWGREKVVAPEDPGRENAYLRTYRESLYGGRAYANALARRGYVVLAADAFYFGDRRLMWQHGGWPEAYREAEAALEPDSEAWIRLLNRAHQELQARVAGAVFQAGATWPGVYAWDDRRTVDFALARPEVDAERIGCVGLSVGGYRSAFLVATEPRIKAAIAVGWMCGLGELWPVGRWQNSVGWVHYVPGLYQEMDLPDVAALACPRPLLIMQGSQDRLFPLDGVERALGKLGAIYEKAGVEERYLSRIYEAPHRFDVEMQEEAFGWLDRWL